MQRELDDVEMLLSLWAEWMYRDEPIAADFPTKASGGMIHSWRKDDEDVEQALDAITVERVNGCYDSLSRYYQEPICQYYGLGFHVWLFRQCATFDDAKDAIRPLFVKHGLL